MLGPGQTAAMISQISEGNVQTAAKVSQTSEDHGLTEGRVAPDVDVETVVKVGMRIGPMMADARHQAPIRAMGRAPTVSHGAGRVGVDDETEGSCTTQQSHHGRKRLRRPARGIDEGAASGGIFWNPILALKFVTQNT